MVLSDCEGRHDSVCQLILTAGVSCVTSPRHCNYPYCLPVCYIDDVPPRKKLVGVFPLHPPIIFEACSLLATLDGAGNDPWGEFRIVFQTDISDSQPVDGFLTRLQTMRQEAEEMLHLKSEGLTS